jgi:hypothetical protein
MYPIFFTPSTSVDTIATYRSGVAVLRHSALVQVSASLDFNASPVVVDFIAQNIPSLAGGRRCLTGRWLAKDRSSSSAGSSSFSSLMTRKNTMRWTMATTTKTRTSRQKKTNGLWQANDP